MFIIEFRVYSNTPRQPCKFLSSSACFASSAGSILGLEYSSVSSLSSAPPTGLVFPYGLFAFTISSLSPNQEVTLTSTLTFSMPAPGAFSYWKFKNDTWAQLMPNQASLDSTRSVVTLTFNATSIGTVAGPGGPAITPPTGTTSSWTTSATTYIPLASTSIEAISTSTSGVGATTVAPVNTLLYAVAGILIAVTVVLVAFFLFVLRVRRRLGTARTAPTVLLFEKPIVLVAISSLVARFSSVETIGQREAAQLLIGQEPTRIQHRLRGIEFESPIDLLNNHFPKLLSYLVDVGLSSEPINCSWLNAFQSLSRTCSGMQDFSKRRRR
jgi:hypothetical protein